jgi:hypothetical protein
MPTQVKLAASWLRYVLCDGPLPAATGRAAWAQNDLPANDERLLTRALNRAGIERHHLGHPGSPQAWWWRIPGDDRALGAPTRPMECSVCGRVLDMPTDHARTCISTPTCPGTYHPNTQLDRLAAARRQTT